MKHLKWLAGLLLTYLAQFIKWLYAAVIKILSAIHSKKRYYIPFYVVVGYFLLVIILVKTSGDSDFEEVLPDKRVNDVTQINPIQVGSILQPHSIDDIVQAIKSTSGPISIGGGRFSMGGQTALENSLHLDMRGFNKVLNLNLAEKQVTVQAGIVWRDLQKVIDQHDLSIKIMQTYANFTVGGSISVNCHGRYIGHGPIISSVLELKLVTASGEIIVANRNENYDVFRAAVGGYGGIGVIAEAKLQLVDNVKVKRKTNLVAAEDYNTFFNNNIRSDTNVIFQNGDLYPPHYDQINNVAWIVTDEALTDTTRVTPEGVNYWLEPKLVEFVSWGDFGKWLRRKIIDPRLYKPDAVVWRNKEASYDVAELEPKSREEQTYVLQEYFIPVNNIQTFIPKMKAVYEKYEVNVINVSLRHAYPDKESFLSWASEEVFAFVIYYKQGTDETAKEIVKQWTVEMTDAILSENGRWYLPYQPHATVSQFNTAFKNAPEYFTVKKRLDSLQRFNNMLLDKYNPDLKTPIALAKEETPGYYRAEEQTVLTVPEWYLVFNPKEYADYLQSGKNPSNFPYYASIREYWLLYDRSIKLVSAAYPENSEYITMLDVIGVSVTMEYVGKMLYEKTIGQVFSWFANAESSPQEQTINQAHRAYSEFIYHTAWYEFGFLDWVGKVWSASGETEASWLRKWERTLFFTFEFTLKAAYGQLIEWAAQASYEAPVEKIYLTTTGLDSIPISQDLQIIAQQDSSQLLSITRWGPFTETLKTLAKHKIDIVEISGNDEIVVSVIMLKEQSLAIDKVQLLYHSTVVTDNRLMRNVYLLPVNELLPIIRLVAENNMTLEHVYDY
jgi:FAD/FMN-containing dehydrogenase